MKNTNQYKKMCQWLASSLCLLALGSLAVSCDLNAYEPIVGDEMNPTKYNLPYSAFMGTNVMITGVGIAYTDTTSIYLRPEGRSDGDADIQAKVQRRGTSGFTVTFKVPTEEQGMKEGKYNLILKRPTGEILIKRSMTPVVNIGGSFDRTPIPGDAIVISKCVLSHQGAVQYAAGNEIIFKGIGFQKSDSLYFNASALNPVGVAANYVSEKEIRFIVPSKATTGPMKFAHTPILISFPEIKIGEELTGFSNNSLTINGNLVRVNGVGPLEGDRVIVRYSEGFVDNLVLDASLSFELPAVCQGKECQVYLRRGDSPLISLGYVNGGVANLVKINAIPSILPSGLSAKDLTLVIKGSGFRSGDQFDFSGVSTETTILDATQASVRFLGKSPVQQEVAVTLRRGTTSQILPSVQIVSAPRIGDFAEGGVVFYLYPENLQKGIVCDVKDAFPQTSNKDADFQKYVFGVYQAPDGAVLRGTSLETAIGSGAANTLDIIAVQGENGKAAMYADTLTAQGYSDWYLPSSEELVQMNANQALINPTAIANGGHVFSTALHQVQSSPGKIGINGYLSSTAYTYSHMLSVSFNTGTDDANKTKRGLNNFPKKTYFRLRAVRSFDLSK